MLVLYLKYKRNTHPLLIAANRLPIRFRKLENVRHKTAMPRSNRIVLLVIARLFLLFVHAMNRLSNCYSQSIYLISGILYIDLHPF